MKAFLMYRDRDFDLEQKPPWNEQALVQDLELTVLFNAMARGDAFLFEVAKSVVLSSLYTDVDTILYRQSILKDCLKNRFTVTGLYHMAIRAGESPKKSYWGFSSKYPEAILHSSVEVLRILVTILKELRHVAEVHTNDFASDGFTRLFTMLKGELSDEYFGRIENHLKELKFRSGTLISAELGKGNKGINYVLRKLEEGRWDWAKRVLPQTTWERVRQVLPQKGPVYSFTLHPRDESGAKALAELNERGINLVANAVAQSTDHILSFFKMLRIELGFYLGCLNLSEQLTKKGERTCFPVPKQTGQRAHTFDGLYDVSLAMSVERKTVANELRADDKKLVVITGANQGGKSTFLRSVGLAQLMMQCGMFVPAVSFSANICDGLFTHYKREEDVSMESGKLDEDLSRMNEIVNRIKPNALLLLNESFTATNEREGSEIARQIVSALLEKGIKIFFVTHLYTFAHGFHEKRLENVAFLRAERQSDGTRTFKLTEGEPLETSFGEDLYHRIFLGGEDR
jgi:DNA mismatch repair ATPase MutS